MYKIFLSFTDTHASSQTKQPVLKQGGLEMVLWLLRLFFYFQSVFSIFLFCESKELGVALLHDVTTFDPFDVCGVEDLFVMGQLYEGLVKMDSDNQVVPGLAKKWTVSNDGKTIVFDLRKSLFFSDGSPIEAEDIVYSLQLGVIAHRILVVKNAGVVCAGILPKEKLGIKSEGNQIVIHLDYPDRFFFFLLCGIECSVLKKIYMQKYGKNALKKILFPCSGPYMLEYYQKNFIRLVRNPYYNGTCGNIQTINFKVCADYQTALRMYKNGDVDVIKNIPMYLIEEVQKHCGTELYQYPILVTCSFMMNNNVKGLETKWIRKALNMSVDREEVIKIMGAHDVHLYGLLPEGFDGYVPQKPLWSSWPMDLRREEAKEILEVEGYTAEKPLTLFYLYTPDVHQRRLANYLQMIWRQIGVKLVPYEKKWESYLHEIYGRNFETAHAGRFSFTPLGFFSELMYQNDHNVTNTCNFNYDACVFAAMGEKDPVCQAELLAKASHMQIEDSEQFGLYQCKGSALVRSRVTNFVPNLWGIIWFWQLFVH